MFKEVHWCLLPGFGAEKFLAFQKIYVQVLLVFPSDKPLMYFIVNQGMSVTIEHAVLHICFLNLKKNTWKRINTSHGNPFGERENQFFGIFPHTLKISSVHFNISVLIFNTYSTHYITYSTHYIRDYIWPHHFTKCTNWFNVITLNLINEIIFKNWLYLFAPAQVINAFIIGIFH